MASARGGGGGQGARRGVIDRLVIELGLDDAALANGIRKAITLVGGLSATFATLSIGITSLEDVISYFERLHDKLAQIGFASKNLGIVGKEISVLGEVSQLAGGQLEDAQASVQGLQAALFNLRFRGDFSDQLKMMRRFGVDFINEQTNQLLDPVQVMRNAAAAMDRLRKQGVDQGSIYQATLSMGFTGGIANAIAQGGKDFEKNLKEALKDQKPLTEREIDSQVSLAKTLTRTANKIDASASGMLAAMTPLIKNVSSKIGELAQRAIPELTKTIREMMHNAPSWLDGLGKALEPIWHLLKASWNFNSAAANLLYVESGLQDIVNTLIGFIEGLIPSASGVISDVTKGAGSVIKDLTDWLNNAAKSIDKFVTSDNKAHGGPQAAQQAGMGLAKGLLHGNVPGIPLPLGIPTPLAPIPVPMIMPTPLASRPGSGASKAPPTAMNTGGGGSVQIGSMTIHTQATDAHGIMGAASDAIQQKFWVFQSDRGYS